MTDRGTGKMECEQCFGRYWPDWLNRLQIMDETDRYERFNQVVCQRCQDRVRDWWLRNEPTARRYYHPA